MANKSIKRRKSNSLYPLQLGIYRPVKRTYEDGGNIGTSMSSNWQKASTPSKVGAITQGLGAIGTMVGAGKQAAQIEDATEQYNEAYDLSQTNFDSSNTNSLLSSYHDVNWGMKDDYNANDFLSSKGEFAGQAMKSTLSAAAQGASAGSVAGPWGAAIGGAAGLIGGVFSNVFGRRKAKRKAKKQAAKLNDYISDAKERAENSFMSSADMLASQNFQDRLANMAAYGGKLFADGGPEESWISNLEPHIDKLGNIRGYTGSAYSEWLDDWNTARLATGRFDMQLGDGNLDFQKKMRDSAKVFYDPNTELRRDPYNSDRMAAGFYNPNDHSVWLGSDAGNPYSSLFIHEYSHASEAAPQEQRIAEILGNSYNDEYLDKPTEVYSRLNEARYRLGLSPDKVYDKKDLKLLKSRAKNLDVENSFWDRYSDDILLQLLNDVADNNSLNMNYTNYAKDGGKIHIKKENRGKFTASAKRAGMGVQEYARHILANKDRYSPTLVKRANFARNFGGRKRAYGGYIEGQEYDLDEATIRDLLNKGYEIEYI